MAIKIPPPSLDNEAAGQSARQEFFRYTTVDINVARDYIEQARLRKETAMEKCLTICFLSTYVISMLLIAVSANLNDKECLKIAWNEQQLWQWQQNTTAPYWVSKLAQLKHHAEQDRRVVKSSRTERELVKGSGPRSDQIPYHHHQYEDADEMTTAEDEELLVYTFAVRWKLTAPLKVRDGAFHSYSRALKARHPMCQLIGFMNPLDAYSVIVCDSNSSSSSNDTATLDLRDNGLRAEWRDSRMQELELLQSQIENSELFEWTEYQKPRIHCKRDDDGHFTRPNYYYGGEGWETGPLVNGDGEYGRRVRRVANAPPNDPLFQTQWYLHGGANCNEAASGTANAISSPPTSMNIECAWSQGYSGRGIVVSVVDDGLQWRHPDFDADRFVSDASFNWNEGVRDPSPSSSYNNQDTHGTPCGGIAYAGRDNRVCGVGVAWGASFGAQRLLGRRETDAKEAEALGFRVEDSNDVISCSWGPLDDGRRKAAMGTLARLTIEQAVTKTGRHGKGTIYVWAGGNGGEYRDNVNYDGYANSIYTIAVCAVDINGRKSYYSEPGASLVVCSSSSPPGIATTAALQSGCIERFGGTSASAPMIAGSVALMLQANPNLTWRDVQNILIRTASKNDPTHEDWTTNGGGLHVNHVYGFGLADVGAAVRMAAASCSNPRSILLPPRIEPPFSVQWTARANATGGRPLRIPDYGSGGPLTVTVSVTYPQGNAGFKVEHVEVVFSASHPRRGELSVVLESPHGTKSVMAEPHFDANPDYSAWVFTSMRHWGESSDGQWRLIVTDHFASNQGSLSAFTLVLHGHL